MEGAKTRADLTKPGAPFCLTFSPVQPDVLLHLKCSLAYDLSNWARPKLHSEFQITSAPNGSIRSALCLNELEESRLFPFLVITDDSETHTHTPGEEVAAFAKN